MRKIWLITKREYLSRVTKKTFIVMTILGPILIALFYAVIIGISINQKTGERTKTIGVIDHSGLFANSLINPPKVNFIYADTSLSNINFEVDGWLIIPKDFTLGSPKRLLYKSTQAPTLDIQGKLTRAIESATKNKKLILNGLRQTFLDSLNLNISMTTMEINKSGELTNSKAELNFGLGVAFAFIIYFFIFMYGVQVMRGVMEEKTNRIVEIIISSVKPFQLMMGKILGIAMVGLTQFLIWIGLSGVLMAFISLTFALPMDTISNTIGESGGAQNQGIPNIMNAFFDLDIGFYALIFLFYFLFGYLLYSAMFAAVGSAVDSESDTQQFMLPITLPLIISFATSFSILSSDPNGSMATFMSIFPLSSPIIMMVRLPFNPPWEELALSMIVLVATFIVFTWLAGRIYKVGILAIGKKPTYKQLFKWMLLK